MGDIIHDFGINKQNKLKRSKWRFNMKTLTSFAPGVLFPIAHMDVIPSSTVKLDLTELIRLACTPAKPTMGDMYFTYGAYFVPYRILNKYFTEIFGEATPQDWNDPVEIVMPTLPMQANAYFQNNVSANGYDALVPNSETFNTYTNGGAGIAVRNGSLGDYLGLPLTNIYSSPTANDAPMAINLFPFLAYERIWTDFWRNENVQNPDPDLAKFYEATPGSTTASNYKFGLHYACKFHDVFTDCLPDTQKGGDVVVGAKLRVFDEMAQLEGNIKLGNAAGAVLTQSGSLFNTTSGVGLLGSSGSTSTLIGSTNLGSALSITTLRNGFALQKLRERDARAGGGANRFYESMLGIFEAHLPNSTSQNAEFVGGGTVPLSMTTVPSTAGDNPGKLGAMSATNASNTVFVETFNEPGVLMIVGTVRVKRIYSDALDKSWTKKRRFDWYDPALAHISEQPVLRGELQYHNDDSATDVFGFQEAWYEYKRPVEKVTGYLRKGNGLDIDAWTYAENFGSGISVYLDSNFMKENPENITKTLVDYNSSAPNYVFIGDFDATVEVTAPMPLYCIPGLIDHIIV